MRPGGSPRSYLGANRRDQLDCREGGALFEIEGRVRVSICRIRMGCVRQRMQGGDPEQGPLGTTDGIAHFRAWGRKLKSVVQVPPPGKGEKADRLHLANFPGLEEAFGISFEPDECSALSIQLKEIDRATRD